MVMQRLAQLEARRIAPEDRLIFNEGYKTIKYPENTKYALGAMMPVDAKYTNVTLEQADRVQNQLQQNLSSSPEYRHQGSVSNDTHVRFHSDIDLLVITEEFYSLEQPQVPTIRYTGDPIKEILDLRSQCNQILKDKFPETIVNNAGAKSISIEGGSLKRKVDVVPSNWFDSNEYNEKKLDYLRGIQVTDKETKTRITNYPFKHNYMLNARDQRFHDNLKKVIRLLKNVRSDSDGKIDFSSFDIAGIAYHMPDVYLNITPHFPLPLSFNSQLWIKYLLDNESYRKSLYVVDGTRKIFDDDQKKMKELSKIYSELSELNGEITKELRLFTINENAVFAPFMD